MRILKTPLEGALIIEPDVFNDQRGFFMETYHQKRYRAEGIGVNFVQDNLSFSKAGALRGLHYQFPKGQAKLVNVIQGEVFDVVVDIRQGSPSFAQWTSVVLSDRNKRQLYVPKGFAHGFCVLSKNAILAYKCSELYCPQSEGGILWSDHDLKINWPVKNPLLSTKDSQFCCLKDIPIDRLPTYEA